MAATKRTARRGSFSVAALSCLLLLLMAPAASAQLPGTSDLKDATEQTGPVGDAIKDAGDTVGGAVEDTTGTVGDTVKDTGGTVGDTVDSVEDGTTGTNVGETIKDTSGSVGNTVKDTGGTTGSTVKDVTNDASGQVDGVVGDVSEATGTEGVLGGKGNKDNTGGNNGPGKDRKNTKKGDAVKSSRLSPAERQERAEERAASTSPLAAATEVSEENLSGTTQAASFAPAFTVEEAIRQAVEAAKAFAFPIALTLLVVGFMLVQNRIDQKDPKLAIAAIDTADELLSFS